MINSSMFFCASMNPCFHQLANEILNFKSHFQLKVHTKKLSPSYGETLGPVWDP